MFNDELSWEQNGHPERHGWSLALKQYIEEKFTSLNIAKDITRFNQYYGQMTYDQKVKVWCEIFIAIAYFESGFNERESSVDVGMEDDRDTWSQGLFSLSIIDQKSYKIPLGFSGDDLLKAENNIRLAVYIMARQIDKCYLIVAPNRKFLYWVVLYESFFNRYDQTDAIIEMVKENTRGLYGNKHETTK